MCKVLFDWRTRAATVTEIENALIHFGVAPDVAVRGAQDLATKLEVRENELLKEVDAVTDRLMWGSD